MPGRTNLAFIASDLGYKYFVSGQIRISNTDAWSIREEKTDPCLSGLQRVGLAPPTPTQHAWMHEGLRE